MVRYLGVLLAFISGSCFGINSRSCEDWIKLIGMQEAAFRARQASNSIHPALARRLGRFQAKLLEMKDVPSSEETNPVIEGFSASESDFLHTLNKYLPKLTRWIAETHPELDAKAATDSVLRRVLANQRFGVDKSLGEAFNNAGAAPTLEALAMELWVRENEDNQRTSLPKRSDLLQTIAVLNMPGEQALMLLKGMDFRKPAPSAEKKWWLYEIVRGVCDDRVEHSADQLVSELESIVAEPPATAFGRVQDAENYPKPTLGQALAKYLNRFDPLVTITRAANLQTFVDQREE